MNSFHLMLTGLDAAYRALEPREIFSDQDMVNIRNDDGAEKIKNLSAASRYQGPASKEEGSAEFSNKAVRDVASHDAVTEQITTLDNQRIAVKSLSSQEEGADFNGTSPEQSQVPAALTFTPFEDAEVD